VWHGTIKLQEKIHHEEHEEAEDRLLGFSTVGL
jgi:hypothetical protein